MSNATGDRAALRKALRERRRTQSATERISAAERIAQRLAGLTCMPAHGRVAGYWAMDGEISLHAWQLRLPGTVEYCLPVLHEDGRLRFAPWRPGAPLVSNRHGIPEPDVAPANLLPGDALDLVVLPLVGFDATGQRLGMGAGWYDRTFAFRLVARRPPWLVGAAFALQEVGQLAAQPWDVPLDALCTERGTYLFQSESPAA